MIKRLYVNNFRCLENFELRIGGHKSLLLIGPNGSGKTSVSLVLLLLQTVARGTTRIRDLLKVTDFAQGRTSVPIRIELDVSIDSRDYKYSLALELPEGFKELRVASETLTVDGRDIFSREEAQVTVPKSANEKDAKFRVDWHLIAMPIIQEKADSDPLHIFKSWLSKILILSPLPTAISGDSVEGSLLPLRDVSNFGEWFSGLLAYSPAAYSTILAYLREVMPDIRGILNPITGNEFRSLLVQFKQGDASIALPFRVLSDGEKCFFICAVVLAAMEAYGPIFCFWDEPDNYLSIAEVDKFIVALRREFQSGGQLILTSHNAEVIRKFSDDNTFFLHRHSHMEPTTIRTVTDLSITGDLVNALIREDVAI